MFGFSSLITPSSICYSVAAPAVLISGDGPPTMSIGYVVLRMTGGAIGDVCRTWPRHGLTIGGVAGTARE